MNKKQVDINVENVSTFRDSVLISLIFSNIIFVIIFLLFFIKSNNIMYSFKLAFCLACVIFIGISILTYIYLDTVLQNRIKEIEEFNLSFEKSKQYELENKQKELLEKVTTQENTDAFDEIMFNNRPLNKKTNSDVKTQFNLDFKNNIQDLSNKMDV